MMEIWNILLANRCKPADIPEIEQPGIYAFFLSPGAKLRTISTDASGLLYVGMTESSLMERNHLLHKASGFSSPRRSFGALLKAELGLLAIPRSPGPSETNFTNYSFTAEGEKRLTEWMFSNLDYAFAVVLQNIDTVESDIIKEMRPPLNLTGWKNPQSKRIKELRSECKNEAKIAPKSPFQNSLG